MTHRLEATIITTSITLLALGLPACSSSQQTPRARATSAQITSAGSPDLRTVDNTGFVGPAGQTRSVSAGTGASQIGRSEGVPPPHREIPGGGETSGATSGATSAATSGATSGSGAAPGDTSVAVEPVARAARALCDRETFCGRVGEGQAFGSADSCMAAMRERVARRGTAEACGNAIRSDRLATCLAAIRAAACEPRNAPPMQPPPACTAESLCD